MLHHGSLSDPKGGSRDMHSHQVTVADSFGDSLGGNRCHPAIGRSRLIKILDWWCVEEKKRTNRSTNHRINCVKPKTQLSHQQPPSFTLSWSYSMLRETWLLHIVRPGYQQTILIRRCSEYSIQPVSSFSCCSKLPPIVPTNNIHFGRSATSLNVNTFNAPLFHCDTDHMFTMGECVGATSNPEVIVMRYCGTPVLRYWCTLSWQGR